jgi:hypothetical protein
MRFIVWTEDDFQPLKDIVIQEMERIDKGFNFNRVIHEQKTGNVDGKQIDKEDQQ